MATAKMNGNFPRCVSTFSLSWLKSEHLSTRGKKANCLVQNASRASRRCFFPSSRDFFSRDFLGVLVLGFSLSFPFFFLLLLSSRIRLVLTITFSSQTTTGYRRSTTSTVSRPCRTSNKRMSISTTGRRTRTTCSSTRWRSLKARCRCPSTRTR